MEVKWEEYRGIHWPVPSGATMSDDQVRVLLESVREERIEQVLDGGRGQGRWPSLRLASDRGYSRVPVDDERLVADRFPDRRTP